jgi:hypothetical protein
MRRFWQISKVVFKQYPYIFIFITIYFVLFEITYLRLGCWCHLSWPTSSAWCCFPFNSEGMTTGSLAARYIAESSGFQVSTKVKQCWPQLVAWLRTPGAVHCKNFVLFCITWWQRSFKYSILFTNKSDIPDFQPVQFVESTGPYKDWWWWWWHTSRMAK